MAFKHSVKLEIGESGKGLLISDLNFSFNVIRGIGSEANKASFIVFNAKEDTQNNIMKKGNYLIFSAGYEDENNIAVVFSGQIIKATTSKDGNGSQTTIEAENYAGNKEAFAYTTLSLGYKEDSLLTNVINDLANHLNIPVTGLQNTSIVLENGLNHTGTVSGLIRKIKNVLKSNGCDLFFDNSEMIVYNVSSTSNFEVVRLTYASGLLKVEKKIDEEDGLYKGQIEALCLLNPKIRPRSTINIDGGVVKGTYIVEKVEFSGDNFGGSFLCKIEALE